MAQKLAAAAQEVKISRQAHQQPALLLVTNAVPAPSGDDARKRAWQLLEAATRTHRVWLVSLVNGPLNLQHWEMLSSKVQGISLVPGKSSWQRDVLLREAVNEQTREQRFDTVLAAGAACWPVSSTVNAKARFCDLDIPASRWYSEQASMSGPGLRWWHQRRSKLAQAQERLAADGCDMLLVSQPEDAGRYPNPQRPTRVVPHDDIACLERLLRHTADADKTKRKAQLRTPAAVVPAVPAARAA